MSRLTRLHSAGLTLGLLASAGLLSMIGIVGFANPPAPSHASTDTVSTSHHATTLCEHPKRDSAYDCSHKDVDGATGSSQSSGTHDSTGTQPDTHNPTSTACDCEKVTPGHDSHAMTGHTVEGKVYVIEWGDTLSEISRKTHVSVDRLAEVNHIQDPNWIWAGSTILIPRD